MIIIEPCCYQKQLLHFFSSYFGEGKRNIGQIATNTDYTLAEFLQWLSWHLPMSNITIACRELSQETVNSLSKLLSSKYYWTPEKKHYPLINNLNIIVNEASEELYELKKIHLDRITIVKDSHEMDVMTVATTGRVKGAGFRRFIITGKFPQTKEVKSNTHVINVQNNEEVYEDMQNLLNSKIRVKSRKRKKKHTEDNSDTTIENLEQEETIKSIDDETEQS